MIKLNVYNILLISIDIYMQKMAHKLKALVWGTIKMTFNYGTEQESRDNIWHHHKNFPQGLALIVNNNTDIETLAFFGHYDTVIRTLGSVAYINYLAISRLFLWDMVETLTVFGYKVLNRDSSTK